MRLLAGTTMLFLGLLSILVTLAAYALGAAIAIGLVALLVLFGGGGA